MIKAIENFGFSLIQPSLCEIRMQLLKAEVENIDKIREKYMTVWEKYGYTVI